MAGSRPSLVFMGTPEFSVPSLKLLFSEGFDIPGVVSNPDRPRGRGRRLSPSPVKKAAQELSLKVVTPRSLKDEVFTSWLGSLGFDFLVVVAFGRIITPDILGMPAFYPVNLHASLLPRLRGPAPIPRAIMEGEEETGITTMVMDEGVDTGDILMQQRVKIGEETTAGELGEVLAHEGARLLAETLEGLKEGRIEPAPQDHARATHAAMISREEAHIRWREEAMSVSRRVRAMDPSPGAYTVFGSAKLKLFRPKVVRLDEAAPPGTVLRAGKDGLLVAAGSGGVLFGELQMPGKKRLDAHAFFSGNTIPPGTVLKGA